MADASQPPGSRLTVVTTYLEMLRRPRRRSIAPPLTALAVLRAERPTVSFYRYLYETVGAPWLWWERRLLDDDTLRAIIHDPWVEITVLYVGGVPAGYVELDARLPAGGSAPPGSEGPPALPEPERVPPRPVRVAAVVGGSPRKGRRAGEPRWKGREVELAYFGLVPEFIGRGLGRYFLNWAIDHAWSHGPSRLWVHTCSLDHPRALISYQRAGFEPYRDETTEIDDPGPWMKATGRPRGPGPR